MGASTEDMLNQFQANLATGPQQGLFGLATPPDPQRIQALLQQLRQQQYQEQANRPTPGPYGYLHDAGRQQFNSVGQQLGGALGGALQTIGAQNGPPPPASPTDAIRNMDQAAAAYNAQLLAQNVPPDQAKIQTLQKLVQWGRPGAADQLTAAQTAGIKNDQDKSIATKNNSQAAMDADNINVHGREEKQNTWTTVATNPEYTIQKNGLGEVRSVKTSDKASLPNTPEQDANDDAIAKKIGDYDLQMSTAVGRGSVDQRKAMLGRVLKYNPDFDEKNFKQSNDALKAYGPSGVQGQMVLRTQNAMNHLAALNEWGKALKNGDSTTANQIGNEIGRQFNNPALASYDTAAPIIANEVSSAIVKGGGGVQERLARVKDFSDTKNDAARNASITAAGSLLGAQYKNNKNLYEQTTLRKDFEKRFPVQAGFPPPPGGVDTAQSAPDKDGWVDMGGGVRVRQKQ